MSGLSQKILDVQLQHLYEVLKMNLKNKQINAQSIFCQKQSTAC